MLESAGLTQRDTQCWTFVATVDSMGPTLEWYVAALFNRHLHWAATSNVYLEDIAFNDFDVVAVRGFDVVAVRGNEIAHVECKTSAPGNVPESDLIALAERHHFLEPAFTLLLVDTSNSVQELADRLDHVLWERLNNTGEGAPFVTRFEPVEPGSAVLNAWKNVYVGNATAGKSNGLLRMLRSTLRHYSTHVRGKAFLRMTCGPIALTSTVAPLTPDLDRCAPGRTVASRSVATHPARLPRLPRPIPRSSWRRGPRQTPSRAHIQALHAAVVAAAKQGEPFPFIFAPPIGPLRSAVQAPLRQALVATGDFPLVVDVLLRGAEHPNPKVRAECAHAMDWLADERCLTALLRLADDPVPRVRWFALHSLACDDCKLTPLPTCAEVVPLLTSKAESDASERVRRRAADTLRLVAANQRPTGASRTVE